MINPIPRILVTGPPGCGKTTVVRKVAEHCPSKVRGFYTREVTGRNGKRIGFDIITSDGRRGVLSRIGYPGPRVGRYGVDLSFLEGVALKVLMRGAGSLVIVDEIGKMECLSPAFVEAVRMTLEGSLPFVGTVALGGAPFIEEVRRRTDITLAGVTVQNRDGLADDILHRLGIADRQ